MNTGIYQITNLQNGKCYVGSAVNFRKRWKEHLRQLSNGDHHSTVMQRAWDKYGETAFEFKKLLVCAKADLIWFEQRAIDALRPAYNICKVAGSVLGYRHTDEFKAEASARAAGNTHRRGRKESPEYCEQAKRSRAMRKNCAHSEETKAKIAAAQRGRTISEERKEHLRRINTGKTYSAETVAKRVQACLREVIQEDGTTALVHFAKGVPKSPETILKMAKARATLSDGQVRDIRLLLSEGRSARSIALQMGIDRSPVLKIRDNTSYYWVK